LLRLAHGWDGTGRDVTRVFDASWGWGAGGVLSTAGDLARWAQALYEGRLLDARHMHDLLEMRETSRSLSFEYGLGVMEFSPKIAGERALGHMGDQPGYHTQMLYFPERRTAIVSIVNSDLVDASIPVQGVLEILQGRWPKWP
jgi:D-alanyl-D-alanine carboxypeptidase